MQRLAPGPGREVLRCVDVEGDALGYTLTGDAGGRFAITGDGSFNYDTRILTFNAKVSGDKTGTLTYTSNYNDGSATLTGEYGGETIDLSR